MDLFALLAMFAGIVVVLGIVALVLAWRWRRAGAWRSSVDAAARKYGLRYLAVDGSISPLYDTASGDFDGIGLRIAIDEEESGFGAGASVTRFMNLEASGRFDSRLVIAARGTARGAGQARVIDYGAAPTRETPTGDPAFDSRVEICDASLALCDALRNTDTRQLVEGLIGDGLRVKNGTVVVRTTRLPKQPADVIVRLDRMIELCRRLSTLQAP